MIKEKGLLTVSTLSLKLAKQIECPGLTEAKYIDLKKSVFDGSLPVIGWAKGETVFQGYESWMLWLVKYFGQYYWLLLTRVESRIRNQNMQTHVQQLFIN